MFAKTAVIVLMSVAAAGAISTVDIQLGVTDFNRDVRYYDSVNVLGYKTDVLYEYAFGGWALDAQLWALAFPGRNNTFAWYLDLSAPVYFTEKPTRVYVAPGLGYSHSETRFLSPDGSERVKHDFFRFLFEFGLRAGSEGKYVDVRFILSPEIPIGEVGEYYGGLYEDWVSDFYLEQGMEAEVGIPLSKHFGISFKAGAIRGNHAIYVNTQYIGKGTTSFVPYAQIGPSIYF
jgi:hypothetical protein